MTTSDVMTTWQAYEEALDLVLQRAQREIMIFDRDLERLFLDRPSRIEQLRRLVLPLGKNRLRIVVRQGENLLTRHPRLARLLEEGSSHFLLRRVADDLVQLTDSIVIGDRHLALVRFHEDHARSRLIVDDEDAVFPYLNRCEEIWQESGTPISARPAGL